MGQDEFQQKLHNFWWPESKGRLQLWSLQQQWTASEFQLKGIVHLCEGEAVQH